MKPQELAYLEIAYNSTLNPLVQKYNENLKNKKLNEQANEQQPAIFCSLDCNNDIDISNSKKTLSHITSATFKSPSCIKPNEWLEFTKVKVTSLTKPLEKFPNGNRNANYLNSLNSEPPHDYYQFHQNDKCHIFPPQRLFNNVTRRSCLPSPHFTQDIAPIYLG
jgi:hypothetical protein